MLTDATAYGLRLIAVTRGLRFKQYSARWTGATHMLLSVGIVADVIRRFLFGSEPLGGCDDGVFAAVALRERHRPPDARTVPARRSPSARQLDLHARRRHCELWRAHIGSGGSVYWLALR